MNFNKVWNKIKEYPGYFYEKEAWKMFNLLQELDGKSLAVELGSLYGRSSIVMGEASKLKGFRFVCVD